MGIISRLETLESNSRRRTTVDAGYSATSSFPAHDIAAPTYPTGADKSGVTIRGYRRTMEKNGQSSQTIANPGVVEFSSLGRLLRFMRNGGPVPDILERSSILDIPTREYGTPAEIPSEYEYSYPRFPMKPGRGVHSFDIYPVSLIKVYSARYEPRLSWIKWTQARGRWEYFNAETYTGYVIDLPKMWGIGILPHELGYYDFDYVLATPLHYE